jgi:CO dehydrogenase maturation factor
MRIAFLGKGGAGKTTTAASFINYVSKRHDFVLAVDADVNVHLSGSLRFQEQPLLVGEKFAEIADYLKGSRTDLNGRTMISSTPPSLQSRFIRPVADDPFVKKYAVKEGNVALLTVGPYTKSDVGGNCYHSKLDSFTTVLHHILDTKQDIIVADTTAGTDNVATSLNLAYDVNAFVVEPTTKSISVYRDFMSLVPHLADRVYVIANKVDGKDDLEFIQNNIPADRLIGTIPFSRHLKRFEQGDKNAIEGFHTEQSQVFDKLYAALQRQERNWDLYLQLLNNAHEKICVDWYNDYYGTDLGTGYDADFSYDKVVAQLSSAKMSDLVSVP